MALRSLLSSLLLLAACANQVASAPAPVEASVEVRTWDREPFDVQGHRGARGNAVENTLPSFAWGLIDGATTLEMDNGITKDGVVVVWHDRRVTDSKCKDTKPAFPGDPAFPYVGKLLRELTIAQIKTIDCGSTRQLNFPMQLTYPGTTIPTLKEVFEFVECADPQRRINWNIESKIDPTAPEETVSPEEFAKRQFEVFNSSTYRKSITLQSFDWRTLVAMKKIDRSGVITLSALASSETVELNDGQTWLAGLKLSSFPGNSQGAKLAYAAASIGADLISPSAIGDNSPVPDPTQPGYIAFTTKDMIDTAHKLRLEVKPWTVDRMNIAQQLLDWGVDGIISDYPDNMRRFVQQQGFTVATPLSEDKVLKCLKKHLKVAPRV